MKLTFFRILVSINLLAPAVAHADATVQIRNSNSNLCLEVVGASRTAGTAIQQNTCNNSASQIFIAAPRPDGSYVVRNRNSNLCVEITGGNRANGAPLRQFTCGDFKHQRFTPLIINSAGLSLISQMDGSCLKVSYGSRAAHAAIVKAKCDLTSSQSFRIEIFSGTLPHNIVRPTTQQIVPVAGPALPRAYKGTNITGAESGDLGSNNRFGYDYAYPTTRQIDYYRSKGFTAFRLPFRTDRIQPRRNGPLSDFEINNLNTVVQYARSVGMWVILDPHDYGYLLNSAGVKTLIGTPTLPASQFADFWAKFAHKFARQPNVMFNIINEPYSQTAPQWQSTAIAAMHAIRSVGATQMLLVPGTSWTGAHSWMNAGGNGETWASFRTLNYAFEVHQYLDSDSSGTHTPCTTGSGSTRLNRFTEWARANGHKALVGEMGWATSSACMREGQSLLNSIAANPGVYIGFTYFGSGWYAGFMTLNPLNFGLSTQRDQPQLRQLQNEL